MSWSLPAAAEKVLWPDAPSTARALQRRLARRVRIEPLPRAIRCVAGLDAAFSRDGRWCVAAAVLWDLERQEIVEDRSARKPLRFPYIPGLLSFREAPALLAALRRLKRRPDALLCDGQGLAHPRRLGLACHVGLLSGLPSVGCAKSRLTGRHEEPGARRGDRAALWDGVERIGTVLRTRDGARPVYVSVGHLADLPSAEALVLRCGHGYRLPEPTRRADRLCGEVSRAIKTRARTRPAPPTGPA